MSDTTSTDHHARLEALAALHGERGWRVARTLMGNDADAADVLQQSFLVLAKDADRIPPGEPWPWFCKVVVHCALNARRVRGRRKSRMVDDPMEVDHRDPRAASPADEAARRELGLVLREALERLPESERDALTLTHLGGLTTEEAADALGMPQNTVKSHCKRGMEKLRARIGHRQGLRDDAGVAAAFAFMPVALPAAGLASMLSGATGALALVGTTAATATLGGTAATATSIGTTTGAAFMVKKGVILTVAAIVGVPLAVYLSWFAWNEHQLSQFDERCDAIEAKVRQYVPSGTTIEKFYDSLPDDGTTWDVFVQFGKQLDSLVERASGYPRSDPPAEESSGVTNLIKVDSVTALYDQAARCDYPMFELDVSKADAVLAEVEPLLRPLLQIQVPRQALMVPPPSKRSRDPKLDYGFPSVEAIKGFRTIHAIAAVQMKLGRQQDAEALLSQVHSLTFSLVPANYIGLAIIGLLRGIHVDFMLHMSECGLLSDSLRQTLLLTADRKPINASFVPAGELVGMFHGDFPDGTKQSYAQRFRELRGQDTEFRIDKNQEWSDALKSPELVAIALDPSSPSGQFHLPPPNRVTIGMALTLQAMSEPHGDGTVFSTKQTIVRPGLCRAVTRLALGEKEDFAPPARQTLHGTREDPTHYTDLESLGFAGLGIELSAGGQVVVKDNEGRETTIPMSWRLATAFKSAPLIALEPQAFDTSKNVVVPVALVKVDEFTLLADSDQRSHRFRVTHFRTFANAYGPWVQRDSDGKFSDVDLNALGYDSFVAATLELLSDEHYLVALSFPKGKAAAPAEAGEGR